MSDSEFPDSLEQLQPIRGLGGSTDATLVRDSVTGQLYVQKSGASSGHIQEEDYTDQIYRSLGIPVPASRLYRDANGRLVKLSKYLEGDVLADLRRTDPRAAAQADARIRQHFVADALLGNWDVVGARDRNIVVTPDGQAWRIDNGGSLRYRAQGRQKGPGQWSRDVGELQTLRNPQLNFTAARVFGGLTDEEIKDQARDILSHRDTIIQTAPVELRETLAARLDWLEAWVRGRVSTRVLAGLFCTGFAAGGRRKGMRQRKSSQRKAKMDLMTGFVDGDPDEDMGLDGKGYFAERTTLGLPVTGKNDALDDDDQPVGGGAPATVLPGPPLKVPMEAADIQRPRLREGVEAARRSPRILRAAARRVRKLDPALARRMLAAAVEMEVDLGDEGADDQLSVANLPESGQGRAVDDDQDKRGHGKLQFFGTDPARPTSLSRKKAGRLVSGTGRLAWDNFDVQRNDMMLEHALDSGQIDEITPHNVAKVLGISLSDAKDYLKSSRMSEDTKIYWPGDPEGPVAGKKDHRQARGIDVDDALLEKVARKCLSEGKTPESVDAREIANYLHLGHPVSQRVVDKVREYMGGGNIESKLEYASRKKSHRRQADASGTIPNRKVDLKRLEEIVKAGLEGRYPKKSVIEIARAELGEIERMLAGNQPGQVQGMGTNGVVPGMGQQAMPQAGRKWARAQGDKPLDPYADITEDDGPGAGGAGGFADRAQAPLQESTDPGELDRPKIRDNPEAARSPWTNLKRSFKQAGTAGGSWNDGQYEVFTKDYGNVMEIESSVRDRDGIPLTAGSMTLSLIHDSPAGRYATVEVNDGMTEHRVVELTVRPRQAARVAASLIGMAVDAAKGILDQVNS